MTLRNFFISKVHIHFILCKCELIFYRYAAAAKSLQPCPTLCDPIDGSPPGSPSLGFSRQEHWSGLPLPYPVHESEKKVKLLSRSDSSQPHGLQPTRLLHPWDLPGKSTGVGCHCLLLYWYRYNTISNPLLIFISIFLYNEQVFREHSCTNMLNMCTSISTDELLDVELLSQRLVYILKVWYCQTAFQRICFTLCSKRTFLINTFFFFFKKQTPMPSMSRKILKQVGVRKWQIGERVQHSKKWILLNSNLLLMPSRESLPDSKLSDFSKVKNIDF